ncbi:hypothetical protein GW17_00002531 [Ensete ventricosum]|nr:hypothetical protein GW17_00002531 [Ensete ventricosum]
MRSVICSNREKKISNPNGTVGERGKQMIRCVSKEWLGCSPVATILLPPAEIFGVEIAWSIVSIGEVDDRKYNAQSDLACLGYRVAHVVLGQTCMGRPCSPRVDVSRLIGRDDVVADVALGLAWHRQRAVTRFGWAKRHVGDEALMVMQSCYNSDSIMTIHRLAEVRECLCILRNMNFKFLCQGNTLITPSRTALDCRLMLSRRGSSCRFILRLASTGGESRPRRWRLTHGTIWWRSSGNVMGWALYRPKTCL